MQPTIVLLTLCVGISCLACQAQNGGAARTFDPAKDMISLYYDHAPDKDDGQSAAADRTLLQSLYGIDWVSKNVIPVSGTYGKNAKLFRQKSDVVMDAVWNDCGGWLAAHNARESVLTELTKRWSRTLEAGGDVWVKEGGPSDITAAVVERIKNQLSMVDTATRIHVVQHSSWNENQTTSLALAYTKKHTHYIRIQDANAYLNIKGGDDAFVRAAIDHPIFASSWKAAFAYYNPKQRLDFSDTGELMYILGLGKLSFDEFRKRFLGDEDMRTLNKPDAG